MLLQLVARLSALLDDPADLILFGRVRLDRNDPHAGAMSEQIVPAVLAVPSRLQCLVEVEAIREAGPNALFETVVVLLRHRAEPVHHCDEQGRVVTQGSANRCAWLAGHQASLSFTAVRTASPKREL